eukprot:CAMPEP_0182464028 /NCGR_PEP_ID=MMETSP1319-20130603/8197_1 /TAXON_ID=172717 /ORGANISM="Bolidomonas pacifica, Strain RCC208" /LENGTH=194 /DNA_ID=CAMNT_0024663633 /DNA_START=25 /DNA_END=605 /DNA_ORIENTATION=-
MSPLKLVFAAALLSAVSAGSSETTTFTGKLILPPRSLPFAFTPLTLNAGEYNATSDADGDFFFVGIKPGVYNLEVGAASHAFPTVKIKFTEGEMDSPKCNLYLYLGSGMQPVDCSSSLTLPALAQYHYFESRPPFSPFAILKNPMLLMMLFSAGMMWYMPKMMEGMDPEQRAQMEKQMAMQSDPQAMLAELWGG